MDAKQIMLTYLGISLANAILWGGVLVLILQKTDVWTALAFVIVFSITLLGLSVVTSE